MIGLRILLRCWYLAILATWCGALAISIRGSSVAVVDTQVDALVAEPRRSTHTHQTWRRVQPATVFNWRANPDSSFNFRRLHRTLIGTFRCLLARSDALAYLDADAPMTLEFRVPSGIILVPTPEFRKFTWDLSGCGIAVAPDGTRYIVAASTQNTLDQSTGHRVDHRNANALAILTKKRSHQPRGTRIYVVTTKSGHSAWGSLVFDAATLQQLAVQSTSAHLPRIAISRRHANLRGACGASSTMVWRRACLSSMPRPIPGSRRSQIPNTRRSSAIFNPPVRALRHCVRVS